MDLLVRRKSDALAAISHPRPKFRNWLWGPKIDDILAPKLLGRIRSQLRGKQAYGTVKPESSKTRRRPRNEKKYIEH